MNETSVVVYSRIPAVPFAKVSWWLRQRGLYRLAKPGGVAAKAVELLSQLVDAGVFGEEGGLAITTPAEAEQVFGGLSFPPMSFKVTRPSREAVEIVSMLRSGAMQAEALQTAVSNETPELQYRIAAVSARLLAEERGEMFDEAAFKQEWLSERRKG